MSKCYPHNTLLYKNENEWSISYSNLKHTIEEMKVGTEDYMVN